MGIGFIIWVLFVFAFGYSIREYFLQKKAGGETRRPIIVIIVAGLGVIVPLAVIYL